MKLHKFTANIIIFSLIFVIFLCPPLLYFFNNESITELKWSLPVNYFFYFLCTLFLYFFYKEKVEIQNKFFFLYKIIIPFTLCFGTIFSFSLFFKAISFFINFPVSTVVIKPDSITNWMFCIFSFLFSGFFEEVLYRFYCPEIFKVFLTKIKSEKIVFFISEILALLLFSLAHGYLGILSLFNAAIAHIVLRITYKKSETVIPGFMAHFLYNIISLILL